jgi:hypothetical protein
MQILLGDFSAKVKPTIWNESSHEINNNNNNNN